MSPYSPCTALCPACKQVLADPEVSHYFEGVDMKKQKAKQVGRGQGLRRSLAPWAAVDALCWLERPASSALVPRMPADWSKLLASCPSGHLLSHPQMAFMALAFGGPDSYRGRDMRTAHQGLPVRCGAWGGGCGELETPGRCIWAGCGDSRNLWLAVHLYEGHLLRQPNPRGPASRQGL